MRARLELELRPDSAPGYAADHLAVAAVLAAALRERLDAPALALGVARVHSVEVAGEDRGLVAARGSADLEEDVAVVERVGRHQQALQLGLVGGRRALERRDLMLGERGEPGVRVLRHRARRGELALARGEALEPAGDRVDAGELHRKLAEAVGAAAHLGIREHALDLRAPVGHALEAPADRLLHRGSRRGA